MGGRGQRPHLGGRVGRIAHADRLRQRHEALEEGIGDVLMQQQARAGDAGLALVVEDGPGRARHGGIQVGIGKDDIGALAAQL
ncbi:hypothetical protein D3C72_2162620 [compost metagenome]